MTPVAAAITSLDQLPLVLLAPEFARLMRRALGTILRDCRLDTIRPRPFAVRPYRWHREDVRAYLESVRQVNHVRAEIDPRQAATRRRKRAR